MDKLANMRVFARVVQQRSFAAAAAALSTTRSAASKQVLALEKELGVKLLSRTTRRVSPTEAGRSYYQQVIRVLQDLEEVEIAVQSLHQEPKGVLRVNGPMSFGTLYLGDAVADFLSRYKDLQVQLTLADQFIDPLENGADVTIRIASTLQDSSLVARKIASVKRLLYAAPGYLALHGEPVQPGDLAGHHCLHYGLTAGYIRWQLVSADGQKEAVVVPARLCANNGEVIAQAAAKGLGIATLPQFFVEAQLRSGALQTVLPDWGRSSVAVYALYAADRTVAAKIRLFIDFLAERFAGFESRF